MRQQIGALVYLYLEELEIEETINTPEFIIMGAAKAIREGKGKNWLPLIVTQIGANKYKIIGNSFVYAVAEKAGLEQVWCLIADDSENTKNVVKLLTQETLPRINLATATWEEIKVGLDYLNHRSVNPLKLGSVKLPTIVDKIDRAERKNWRESLLEVTNLKCGISKGEKLKIFKEIFYTIPESDAIVKPPLPNKLTVAELKNMAKERGLSGYSKLKKDDLIKLLFEE